jgi:hypothetical protein
LLHHREIIELATREVVELCPFMLAGHASGRVRDMDLVIFGPVGALAGDVDELEDQGAPSNDSTTAW